MIHRTEPGVSRASRLLLWASITTVAGFLIWANWAELDTITRATGQVIASSRNQVIQTPEGGVLESMLVREGDAVKRGQVLFRFDQTRAGAGHKESQAKAAALRAAVARLQAEVFGGEPHFKGLSGFPELQANQRALFNRRQAAIQEEVAALENSLALVKSELDMNLPLQKSGDVSRAEVLKLQRQVADVQGQITNRRNKYFQDAQADLAKAQEELESVEQVLAQRREQLAYTEVRAPMDGVVRNVRLTTQGGVAKPGDEILQIVPLEDDLIVEAKVRPADIAFIKPGLPATVKLDAYDYSIYGSLQGAVSYISADTLNEETRAGDMAYYRVQVKTRDHNLSSRTNERIDIQPGMTATVEIKTGRQTVLRYLTKPITKTLDESLGER
ncbi:MAG: HlyD family type I secretion periplasmic adaptor subunit [Pseudomonadota bacterium]|nr:HlyD family type I secretion periplasmic adaptor subunit [Pseudomonadota bacterium]MDP1905232.1 HlyD family type I secretion periplasmic adaptor subunit [Pseudomonadota bacterium]MDP2352794.1 HlyD family type I secretion periplasmic adaptor subunit [Pseudomonadota bacterium]